MSIETPRHSRAGRLLLAVGVVALAFNLRPAAVSVGPVLDEIRADLGMSATLAGVLTALPVLAFAGVGAVAAALARRIGVHRLTLVALLTVVAGLGLRAVVGSPAPFLALTLLALAGMATANVLLPSLVRLHFPGQVGLLTAAYSTSLAVGLTTASAVTVPVAQALGSWRWGLAVWAATALLAALPWLALIRHDRAPEAAPRTVTLRQVAGTPIGRSMALLFGMQSLQAYAVFGWFAQVYRDAGFTPAEAGALLGVVTGVGIPLSFAVPRLAGRLHDQRALLVGLIACYPVGYLGLILAPATVPWVWAVLVGTGTAVFPLVLTLIGLRARTAAGTVALSGFTQSVGYLLAALGPFGVGVLYDLTGGWTVPLSVLLVLLVPQLLAGLAAGRPAYLEDQLYRTDPRT